MYRLVPDHAVVDQVRALPVEALLPYSAVLDALEIVPWNGASLNAARPDGAVRRWHFGPQDAGMVVYLIVETPPEVHLLRITWLGP